METKHKQLRRKLRESSPVTMLEFELRALHRDLRTIAKPYIARLENDLFVCLAAQVIRTYREDASGNAAPDPYLKFRSHLAW